MHNAEMTLTIPRWETDFEVPDEDPLTPKTLVACRKILGLTQTDFAEVLGTSVRTVRSWERSKRDDQARNCTGPPRKLIIYLIEDRLDRRSKRP